MTIETLGVKIVWSVWTDVMSGAVMWRVLV